MTGKNIIVAAIDAIIFLLGKSLNKSFQVLHDLRGLGFFYVVSASSSMFGFHLVVQVACFLQLKPSHFYASSTPLPKSFTTASGCIPLART